MQKLMITLLALFCLSNLYGQDSVSVIFEDDLINRSATDAGAALQGKVAGLYVMNTSGAPGETARLRLRGFTTHTGNGGPLLIVDGLKVENIQHLDPSMIEKVEVLKDAAATALYGIQAGNGVIRITTRKGSGKISVAYDFKLTSSFPGMKAELLDASGWIERVSRIEPDIRKQLESQGYSGNHTDWQDVMYGNGFAHQHGLTVQGGNERGGIYAAVNYLDKDGIMTGSADTHRRISAQLNGQYDVTDWVQIGMSASFAAQDISYVPQGEFQSVYKSVLLHNPITKPYFSGPEEFTPDMYQAYLDGKNILYDSANGKYYSASPYVNSMSLNPLMLRDVTREEADNQDLNAVVYAKLAPFEGFTFTTRAGYRNEQQNRYKDTEPYYMSSWAHSDVSDHMILGRMNSGYQAEAIAEYAYSKRKHGVETKAGMYYENVNQTFKSEDTSREYGHSDLAFYAQAGYTFDSRYSIQASLRADKYKSDMFAPEKTPWMVFPTVSAGAVVLKEPFVKIRGSWGKAGSTANMEAFYHKTMKAEHELSDQMDIGADLRFFNRRLGIAADWYVKNTSGLTMTSEGNLLDLLEYQNFSLMNRGVEIDMSWKDRVGEFSYRISGNLSTLHNEVTSMPDGIEGWASSYSYSYQKVRSMNKKGYPIGFFYGYPSASYEDGSYPQYEELTYLGQGIPTMYFGLTLNLAYKGFDFTMYGSGTSGNSIASCAYEYQFAFKNVLRDIEQKNLTESYQWESDEMVYDGSYFRIRHLQLGYTIPERMARKIFMQNVRLYVSFDDWFTFSSYPGGDPETAALGSSLGTPWERDISAGKSRYYGSDNMLGFDYGSYPVSKKILFGISIVF